MALGGDSSRITLHTGRSSRVLLGLAFGAGIALLGSAFLATDAMPDRIFRGIVGTSAAAFFGGYLAWALSHRIIATPEASRRFAASTAAGARRLRRRPAPSPTLDRILALGDGA